MGDAAPCTCCHSGMPAPRDSAGYPVDEEGFRRVLRYVGLNPVRAGLVGNAWDRPWSSARPHVTGIDNTGILDVEIWAKRFDSKTSKDFLREGVKLQD